MAIAKKGRLKRKGMTKPRTKSTAKGTAAKSVVRRARLAGGNPKPAAKPKRAPVPKLVRARQGNVMVGMTGAERYARLASGFPLRDPKTGSISVVKKVPNKASTARPAVTSKPKSSADDQQQMRTRHGYERDKDYGFDRGLKKDSRKRKAKRKKKSGG